MAQVNSSGDFRFADLFAGLGGFHQAAVLHGGRCVFASEIDPILSALYRKNFGVLPHGDIRAVRIDDVPEHEVLFAGFPCQPFSKAGKQLGWQDTVRGTLVENIISIVGARLPQLIMLENVAHFVRHDEGQTYAKVHEALSSLGYHVKVKQLSPHHFGVPHIRERMYMLASLNKLDEDVWPNVGCFPARTIADILDQYPADAVRVSPQVTRCLEVWQEFLDRLPPDCKLPSFPIWAMEFGATYPFGADNLYNHSSCSLARYSGSFGKPLADRSKPEQWSLLPPYARGKHQVFPKWKKDFIRQNRVFFETHRNSLSGWVTKLQDFPPSLQKFEWNCQGADRDISKLIVQFRASGMRVKKPTTSPSLVAMTSTQIPIVPWESRYMTVRERARLQSMDSLKHLPEGDLAMSALGNAVNVTVVSEILRSVLRQQSFLL